METNFKIIDNIAISYNEKHLDLHNNFKLENLISNSEGKFLQLIFVKLTGDWVKENEVSRFSITFSEIDYFFEEAADPEANNADKDFIYDLTFFPSNSREINDGIISEAVCGKDNDFIIFFEDSRILRIHSKSAIVQILE